MERISNRRNSKIWNSAIYKISNGMVSSFLSLALLGLILYFIDASKLPDFDSYYVMYEGGNLGGSYWGFSKIALILKTLGLDYREFRFLVLAVGLMFVIIIFDLRRNCYLFISKNSRIYFSKSFELAILVSIFIFEFYLIRLRAGISIFFFLLFFYLWQCGREYKQVRPLRFPLLLSTFFLSALVHFETFICIILFVGPVILWSRYVKLCGALNEFLFFTICLGIWLALFWFGIAPSLADRGPELYSKLNPIRLIMISILPMIVWPFIRTYYSGNLTSATGKLSFQYLYALNFVASAIALFLYYYLSTSGEHAGEAIVRVMTLSSFGAILSLALGGLSRRNSMAFYILIVNSLFFLYTVYR